MQCPSCYNESLTPTEEGKLVCDECGEEFAGYREEEMDAFLAGTAVSNRESQSSQARSVRDKIVAKTTSSGAEVVGPARHSANDEMLVCEGAFILAKVITDRLIDMRYTHSRIKAPLFELLTHWVRRRNDGEKGLGGPRAVFRPHHVLALISLAAVYVRSPMLPRDLCRLVATRQVPYYSAWKEFPENVRDSTLVRELFTPVQQVSAFGIVDAANIFARDENAWPPIRESFKSHVPEHQVTFRTKSYHSSFPVGHMHITILRMTRLLGLPDEFGARVLRFSELRQIASKMARVLKGLKGGPWDNSRVDAYDIGHIPAYVDPKKRFSEPVAKQVDIYGFPTDESLQVDFINTMRLCYGRRKPTRNLRRTDYVTQRDRELRTEWEKCKDAMEVWLRYGNPEDIDVVVWTGMPPNVLSTTKGKDLREYSKIVDDILLGQMEEDVPELWGRFTKVFEEMGEESHENEKGCEHERRNACFRTDMYCSYNFGRSEDVALFEPLEGRQAMQDECGYERENGLLNLRRPLRELPDLNWRPFHQPRIERARHALQRLRKIHAGRLKRTALEALAGSEAGGQRRKGRRQGRRDGRVPAIAVQTGSQNNVLNGRHSKSHSRFSRTTEGLMSGSKGSVADVEGLDEDAKVDYASGDSSSDDEDCEINYSGHRMREDSSLEDGSLSDMSSSQEERTSGGKHHFGENGASKIEFATNATSAGSDNSSRGDGRVGLRTGDGIVTTAKRTRKQAGMGRERDRGISDSERSFLSSSAGREEALRGSTDEGARNARRARSKSPELDEKVWASHRDFLFEPAGIGLAWSILRHFFAGSNVTVSRMDAAELPGVPRARLEAACDRTMKIVLFYVLGLKGKRLRKGARRAANGRLNDFRDCYLLPDSP